MQQNVSPCHKISADGVFEPEQLKEFKKGYHLRYRGIAMAKTAIFPLRSNQWKLCETKCCKPGAIDWNLLKFVATRWQVISFPHQSSDFYLGAFMIVASMGSVHQTTLVTVILAG